MNKKDNPRYEKYTIRIDPDEQFMIRQLMKAKVKLPDILRATIRQTFAEPNKMMGKSSDNRRV